MHFDKQPCSITGITSDFGSDNDGSTPSAAAIDLEDSAVV